MMLNKLSIKLFDFKCKVFCISKYVNLLHYIHCNQLTYCYELFPVIFSTVYNLNLDSLLNFTLVYGRHDEDVILLQGRGLIYEKKRYI